MGLDQYDSLEEYCDPHTASSVFLMLLLFCANKVRINSLTFFTFCRFEAPFYLTTKVRKKLRQKKTLLKPPFKSNPGSPSTPSLTPLQWSPKRTSSRPPHQNLAMSVLTKRDAMVCVTLWSEQPFCFLSLTK